MTPPQDTHQPIEIFSGTIWEAELLKSILDDNGIESYLLDEFTGTLAPWYTAGGGAGSVKIVVSGENFEQAMEVVQEFQKNLQATSGNESTEDSQEQGS